MRLTAIAILLAVAGCTTYTPWPEVASMDVCYHSLYGNQQNKVGAETEMRRRGLDCQPYYPAIIAREQQRQQALSNASNYFLQRSVQPPPPMLPMPTTCRSIPVGNGAYQTVCN